MKKNFKLLLLSLLIVGGGSEVWAYGEEDLTSAGWQEVTELPKSTEELNKNYYVIYATEANLMLAEEYGTGKEGDAQENQLTVVYRTPANPAKDETKVWTIEYSTQFDYGFRSLAYPTHYIQTRESATWRVQAAWETNQSMWTRWNFAYDNDSWTIENCLQNDKRDNGAQNKQVYLGPWIEGEGVFRDNMVAAGNKTGNYIGHFKIYAISRSDYDALVKSMYASEEEYKALADAIKEAEQAEKEWGENIFGFEKGEYAPYSNTEHLKALATAKAINSTENNFADDVEAAIAALTETQKLMVANTEEMNGIYDGTFETAANNGAPLGWITTHSVGLGGDYKARAFVGENKLAAFNETKSAFYIRFDTTNSGVDCKYKYGETDGYTLPLKKETYYTISLDFAAWSGTFNPDSKLVLDVVGEDGEIAGTAGANPTVNGNETPKTTDKITLTFKTGDAGNYVIVLHAPEDYTVANNNYAFVISNITLKKTNITIDEDEKYDAVLDGTVASVTLNRTIKEGINTLVLPFDLSQEEVEKAFGEGATVYTVKSYANDNITFEVAEGIEANVPCLLDAPEEGAEYEFENVTLVAAEETETEVDGLKMIGVYENGTVTKDECNYIVNDKNLYLVDTGNVKIKTTRAYFNVPSANEIKTISMSFGGEATGIVNVPAAEAKTGKIYDLQGREVKNPARGIYIIDGQKVLISK